MREVRSQRDIDTIAALNQELDDMSRRHHRQVFKLKSRRPNIDESLALAEKVEELEGQLKAEQEKTREAVEKQGKLLQQAIQVLDQHHTDWSPARARRQIEALIPDEVKKLLHDKSVEDWKASARAKGIIRE